MRYFIFCLTVLLCLQPALAQRDRGIEGRVISVDSRAGVFTVEDEGANYVIYTQRSTRYEGFDRLGDLRGQRVEARTMRMDDGRLIATQVRIAGGHHHHDDRDGGYYQEPMPGVKGSGQPGYVPNQPAPVGLRVNSLSNGQIVPQSFSIAGQATPNSAIWVQITPNQQLIPGVISAQMQPWRVEGRSDPSGYFNIPVQANVPNGSRLDIQVNGRDSYGNQLPPYGVSVTRR